MKFDPREARERVERVKGRLQFAEPLLSALGIVAEKRSGEIPGEDYRFPDYFVFVCPRRKHRDPRARASLYQGVGELRFCCKWCAERRAMHLSLSQP
jgi:hypothetical protein